MKKYIQHMMFIALATAATHSFALTPAGTVISNQATLEYTTDTESGVVLTEKSMTADFVVMQLLDVMLTSMDATAVLVNAPDIARVLTFKVTNIGNGTETFRLTRNDLISGDDFDPILPTDLPSAMYLENGLEPGFQLTGPNADTKYIAGSNDPKLAAEGVQQVYVLANIPAGQTMNSVGRTLLSVAGVNIDTNKPSGSVVGGITLGDKTLEQILGATHGVAEAVGAYKVSGLIASFDKTILKVVDPKGGSQALQGSVVTYQLVYEIKGDNGKAQNIVIADTLPANMVYVPNTLKLDGVLGTDVVDSDALSFGNGKIMAQLGNQVTPYKAIVEFDAVVQ